jgi:divalent metal cation (Fe/Co/Zn/Cd) transporter
VVIISKELLFKYIIRIGKEIESNAVKSDAWHQRTDALTSLCALAGITIAVLGGKGYESADDWAAIITSLFIFYNAIRIMKLALNEIMDIEAPEEFIEEIKNISQEKWDLITTLISM